MENIKLSQKDYGIFFLKSLFFLGFAWLGFIMTLLGFFYGFLIWIVLIISTLFFIIISIKKKIFLKPSCEMFIVSTIFLSVSILFVSFSTPTVFSGRDQGSLSEASIRLSQNHKLEFSTSVSTEFFKIYGPGRALNFPGFYYMADGNLKTQFPLVYISWLATFYSIFGIAGFAIANCVLLFFFFLSFFLLARFFMGIVPALSTSVLTMTSFVFMWFSKFTLSENIALPLLWIGILALLFFFYKFNKTSYFIFWLSLSLLCFTRIEGLIIFPISMIILLANKKARDFIKPNIIKLFFLPLVACLVIFVINFFQDINFFTEIAKAILPEITSKTQFAKEIKNSPLFSLYNLKVFYLYGLLGFFVFGIFGVTLEIWKKKKLSIIPLIIVFPTFIYFISLQITPDHPWMLRRFIFSILPAAIFYCGLLIAFLFEKSQKKAKLASAAIFLILLIGTLPAFSKFLFFSENKNLLKETGNFSSQFSENDLLLIDRETTGDGWTMISGPMNFLFKKNAAYFFNFNDLAKIDLKKFERVYLIAPNEKVSSYIKSDKSGRLMQKNSYSFTFSKLDLMQNNGISKTILPEKNEFNANGKIFKVVK